MCIGLKLKQKYAPIWFLASDVVTLLILNDKVWRGGGRIGPGVTSPFTLNDKARRGGGGT